MQLALSASGDEDSKGRLRLPPAVPGFSTPFYWVFTVIWTAMFLLALVGPGLASSLFVPLAMLAVFPGAPLVLLGIFVRLRMEPREVEDHWF